MRHTFTAKVALMERTYLSHPAQQIPKMQLASLSTLVEQPKAFGWCLWDH
jgi:hypothetical protein